MDWIYEKYGKDEVDFCERELAVRPIFWVPQFKALDLYVRNYEQTRRILAVPEALAGNCFTENVQWFVSRYLSSKPQGVKEIAHMNYALMDHNAKVSQHLLGEMHKKLQQRQRTIEMVCSAMKSRDSSAIESARSLLRDDTLDEALSMFHR